MSVKQSVDVRDQILEHLKSEERSLRWLSRQTHIAYGTLYAIFGHKIVNLSKEKCDTINTVLGTEFKVA